MMKSLLLSESFSGYVDAENKDLKKLDSLAHINIFVGSNNSGKSRFMRLISREESYEIQTSGIELDEVNRDILRILDEFLNTLSQYSITSANEVSVSAIKSLMDLPNFLNLGRDNYSNVRQELEKWRRITNINRTEGGFGSITSVAGAL